MKLVFEKPTCFCEVHLNVDLTLGVATGVYLSMWELRIGNAPR